MAKHYGERGYHYHSEVITLNRFFAYWRRPVYEYQCLGFYYKTADTSIDDFYVMDDFGNAVISNLGGYLDEHSGEFH